MIRRSLSLITTSSCSVLAAQTSMAAPVSLHLPTPGNPWASGRVLTPSQRETKRYNDRITKRAKAKKQKDSIKELQDQIAALQNMIQTHQRSCEISREYSLDTCLLPLTDLPPCLNNGLSTIESSQPTREPSGPPNSDTEICITQQQDSWATVIPSSQLALSPSLQVSGSWNVLEYANGVLDKARELDKMEVCFNRQLNEDAIIRGVLEGWHFLQGRTYSCPLWTVVSQIDEKIFMHSGIVTRLSMLSTIHKMLAAVVHVDQFNSLPTWYRPRPSQLNFPHYATADYFAWPGFRERLVISNCEVLTDRFFKYFASCFRLFWPHSISDSYKMVSDSGLYSFSDAFRTHAQDISTWTMCKEFFLSFPELQEDMQSEISISTGSLKVINDNLH
ncbi:hypothetical protein BGW36DRAFT_382659 [Talaromyces proteolyticus]|uniref:BZIP domain-containing protein n=1 Tax=Talaromyces proteolyticus TaxID=1131652 RepID=A0AAD4KLF0_9EURO|nr:uncharacterized protein BGW36DRAFT_382659 [Talaromyces proteolyticus]KAH8695418.1 hypothetical protein BGW36DRAFT_382659 [Talaromyces proteolyticus]